MFLKVKPTYEIALKGLFYKCRCQLKNMVMVFLHNPCNALFTNHLELKLLNNDFFYKLN